MEHSSFFNSVNGDRKYKAEDFAKYFSAFLTNGVFPNPSSNLQVISNSNMTVTIKAGLAWINGYLYYNDSDLILPISTADGTLNRIDRIVVKLSTSGRAITTGVKKGTFASSPVAPALQRDADVYELGIADIYIAAGATLINQANITDRRQNQNYCGVISSLITPDTATLFNQFTDGFNTWFEGIKNTLGSDTAGNLLNIINNHKDDKNNPHGVTVAQIGATSKTDNTKQIPHLGTTTNSSNAYGVATSETILANQKFTIKFNVASTGAATLNISTIGSAKAIKKLGGADASIKAGVYTLFYDGTNFQLLGEGGEYGTALPNDVRSSKTLGTENGVVQGTLDLSKLTPENIRNGVVIDGTTGSLIDVSTIAAGDNLVYSDTDMLHKDNSYYLKVKEFKCTKHGTIRIKFNQYSQNASSAYGVIYKNDVRVGSIRGTISSTPVLFSEDFECAENDLFSLYMSVGNPETTMVYNSLLSAFTNVELPVAKVI